MDNNVLIREEPVAAEVPAILPDTTGGNTEAGVASATAREPAGQVVSAGSQHSDPEYKLDWESIDLKLAKGRFVHTLRRPTVDEILARDKEIESETPIGRDGSFSLPDPTATEEIDAKYYDKIMIAVTGYPGEVPARHKAAAFNGLYRREIDLNDGTDVFAEEITIVEEIGTGDEPDFTIKHVLRQPTEADLKKFRQRSHGGELKPGRRGKSIFRPYSNLRLAITLYDQWLVSISGAQVGGKTFSADNRLEFLAAVDPLIKRGIVSTIVGEVSSGLLD